MTVMAEAPRAIARPRKILVSLTDDEWREFRVAAVEDDTTMQAIATTLVLGWVQRRRAKS